MKILISHASIYKKAGWGRIFPLAVGLTKLDNHVTILTTNPKISFIIRKEYQNGVEIIIFPEILPSRISRMGFGLISLITKIFYVLTHHFDVVHSDNGHRPLSGIPCRIHKKIYKSIYVAEWYDWYGKGGQYDSKKRVFKFFLGRYELKYEIKDKIIADGVVVLSEVLRKRAEKIKTFERIIKIHGGSDVSSLPFIHDNTELKSKYNIDIDTLTLGYINSNSYRIEELMPLINILSDYKGLLNIRILIYGNSDLIIRQIPKDILNKFQFFGWIDYSTDYEKLQLTDVFFLFKEELLGNKAGWPNCLGDYLACGRPVLLNPVGEVIDFVEKYPVAFFPTSTKPDDILANLEYIKSNLSSVKARGSEIRMLAENFLSWEKKSQDLYEFYKHLLSLRKA